MKSFFVSSTTWKICNFSKWIILDCYRFLLCWEFPRIPICKRCSSMKRTHHCPDSTDSLWVHYKIQSLTLRASICEDSEHQNPTGTPLQRYRTPRHDAPTRVWTRSAPSRIHVAPKSDARHWARRSGASEPSVYWGGVQKTVRSLRKRCIAIQAAGSNFKNCARFKRQIFQIFFGWIYYSFVSGTQSKALSKNEYIGFNLKILFQTRMNSVNE